MPRTARQLAKDTGVGVAIGAAVFIGPALVCAAAVPWAMSAFGIVAGGIESQRSTLSLLLLPSRVCMEGKTQIVPQCSLRLSLLPGGGHWHDARVRGRRRGGCLPADALGGFTYHIGRSKGCRRRYGLADIARHVIGRRSTQEGLRAQYVLDDVTSNICQALVIGGVLAHAR
jgi:hypothetical protein